MALLTASKLGKRFDGVVALSGIDLSIEDGEIVGLIGPNGAGKTTAFNVITGVLPLSEGGIHFAGRDISRLPPERRARLGMVRTFQNIRLFDDLTVRQNVMAGAHATHGASFFATVFGMPAHRAAERRIVDIADRMLARTGLTDFADEVAAALSYGDRRRVEIARALATGPKLLLLDEPAAGMNEAEKAVLGNLIRQLNETGGLTIVLVEHNVELVAKLCRQLVVINKGEILANGPTNDVLKLAEVKQVYLGRARRKRNMD